MMTEMETQTGRKDVSESFRELRLREHPGVADLAELSVFSSEND